MLITNSTQSAIIPVYPSPPKLLFSFFNLVLDLGFKIFYKKRKGKRSIKLIFSKPQNFTTGQELQLCQINQV